MMRSDLMLDKDSFCCCWKQVELNTIASGFGWMGPASGLIHRLVRLHLLLLSKLIVCLLGSFFLLVHYYVLHVFVKFFKTFYLRADIGRSAVPY